MYFSFAIWSGNIGSWYAKMQKHSIAYLFFIQTDFNVPDLAEHGHNLSCIIVCNTLKFLMTIKNGKK